MIRTEGYSESQVVLIPLYSAPLRFISMIGGKLEISDDEGNMISDPEGVSMARSIGNLRELLKWQLRSGTSKVVCYYFSIYSNSEFSSPILLPVLRQSEGRLFPINQWYVPPFTKGKFNNLTIPKNTNFMGYVQEFCEDPIIGKYCYGGVAYGQNVYYVPAVRAVCDFVCQGDIDESYKPIPINEENAPKICSNGLSNCLLCSIDPGTIIFRWEGCIAIPTSIDGEWNFISHAENILRIYINHGWDVIVGTNSVPLTIINNLLVGVHACGKNSGYRRYEDKILDLAHFYLTEPTGRPFICYDCDRNVLTLINTLAVTKGIPYVTILHEDEKFIKYGGCSYPATSLVNGIVTPI